MQQVNALKKCLILFLLQVYVSLAGFSNTGGPAFKYKAVDPVYARLEVSLTDYSNTETTTEMNYSQLVEVKIRFYSDAACTNLMVLPRDITWQIEVCGYFETETSYEYNCSTPYWFAGTARAGQSESYLDNILSWEGSWLHREDDLSEWVLLEKWRDDYELVSVDNGATIVSPVYPQHTQGF